MRIILERFRRVRTKGTFVALTLAASLAAVAPAAAQYVQIQSFEVTPFIGVRMGGTFEIEPGGPALVEASLEDAQSLGFSAGVRFDELSLVEFRWSRSTSALRFGAPFAALGASVGDVTLNQFHADFTREFPIREVKGLRSFMTGSLGVTHLGAADDGFTRFSFGLGAGLKQFLGSRFAIRAEAQWLPIVVEPSVSGFACGTIQFGGCLVVLNGELVQQFQLSVGPVFRF
jgi:opacity protein-like surface antigen